jgi:Rieske Fe-S protein
MQTRRNFIKQSCSLCVGAIGLGVLASQLSSCAPLPIYKAESDQDIINVPLTSFTELNNMVIVRNSKMDFDILVVKLANGNYNALLMKCTHQESSLTANKTGLFCSLHGSSFDLQGNVTKEPALQPLKKFTTLLTNASIQINIKS